MAVGDLGTRLIWSVTKTEKKVHDVKVTEQVRGSNFSKIVIFGVHKLCGLGFSYATRMWSRENKIKRNKSPWVPKADRRSRKKKSQ